MTNAFFFLFRKLKDCPICGQKIPSALTLETIKRRIKRLINFSEKIWIFWREKLKTALRQSQLTRQRQQREERKNESFRLMTFRFPECLEKKYVNSAFL